MDNTTLAKDIKTVEDADLSRLTIIDYLDALSRLMIFEEQPAFNMHIRSANSLRKSPKRHFCDVSLAIAALKRYIISLTLYVLKMIFFVIYFVILPSNCKQAQKNETNE